jgi:hypothetical protein
MKITAKEVLLNTWRDNKLFFISALIAILLFAFTPIASASLGTYQQNTCVDIKTVSNSTAINISSLSWPNSTVIVNNKVMNKTDHTFNYTYCGTKVAGKYIYDYVDASGNVYVNDFVVTPSGDLTSNTFFIILLILSFALLLIAFIYKNYVFAFISGLTFLVAGVYTMIYGFGNITSTYTYVIAIVIIGLGAILSITSAFDMVNENAGGEEEEVDF